jgi:hypothetical protein
MFCAACATSPNPSITGAQIPQLDPRDRAPCYDPGVDSKAPKAATENRIAWAACKDKHGNVVAAFDKVVAEFGASPDIVKPKSD